MPSLGTMAAENKWRGDSIPVWVDAEREMVEALMERVPSSGGKRLCARLLIVLFSRFHMSNALS